MQGPSRSVVSLIKSKMSLGDPCNWSTRLNFSGGMKALDENTKFIMDEVLDREHVESAKNGMMFLPLEAEKLQQVRAKFPAENRFLSSWVNALARHKIFISYRSFSARSFLSSGSLLLTSRINSKPRLILRCIQQKKNARSGCFRIAILTWQNFLSNESEKTTRILIQTIPKLQQVRTRDLNSPT